ncbi:MAG: methyltransferase domain-containing protein [Anaerolineales bacterium]|nr:methyltransferase domain-containing protein [Anaerolineales bacterium]
MNNTTLQKILRAILWRAERTAAWMGNIVRPGRSPYVFNLKLFADVNSLDDVQIELAKTKFQEFAQLRGYDKDAQKKWETHIYRILLSANWMEDALQLLPEKAVVMDLGTENVVSDYWRFRFPHVQWINTNFDLRYPWHTSPASCDLIICTETVEHLADHVNPSFNEGFYQSGMTALLQESFKALRPGGYIFLTTPNAASVIHVKAVLQGDPPWFFIQHVREYTKKEVSDHLTSTGFVITQSRDVHCMSVLAYSDYAPIFKILIDNGFSPEGRGDDLFFLARKPG